MCNCRSIFVITSGHTFPQLRGKLWQENVSLFHFGKKKISSGGRRETQTVLPRLYGSLHMIKVSGLPVPNSIIYWQLWHSWLQLCINTFTYCKMMCTEVTCVRAVMYATASTPVTTTRATCLQHWCSTRRAYHTSVIHYNSHVSFLHCRNAFAAYRRASHVLQMDFRIT